MKYFKRWACLSAMFTFIVVVSIFTRTTNSRSGTTVTTQSDAKNCSMKMREELINSHLSVTIHDNIDATEFERSGCFVIDTSKSGLYRIIHERNFADIACTATQKRFLTPQENEEYTALASQPGSGSFWVRHLLEEITGIYTGSVFNEAAVRKMFIGESTIHNVIAVKTHFDNNERLKFMLRFGKIDTINFTRAVLIVRDPLDAALSNYNRRHARSHTEIMSRERFNLDDLLASTYQLMELEKSIPNLYVRWIDGLQGDGLVLFYDKLKTDLLNSLLKMAAFFQSEVTLKKLWCVYNNQSGTFLRKSKPEWMSREKLTNDHLEETIRVWKEAINDVIKRRADKIATN